MATVWFMHLRILATSALLCGMAMAGAHSGHGDASLWTAATSWKPGEPVQAVIRLAVDPGWHTYWSNPGEGGMKLGVKWELPAGWQAGEIEEPVPKRFKTGELAGFGYEGVVLFPVRLSPPASGDGPAILKCKVSWLTCNDSACVPGDAQLEVTLTSGPGEPTTQVPLVTQAVENIPRANPDMVLGVEDQGANLRLTLNDKTQKGFDASDYEVFPRTPQVVDPAAPIEFRHEQDWWVAEVKKNEFATDVTALDLVFGPRKAVRPFVVSWKKDDKK